MRISVSTPRVLGVSVSKDIINTKARPSTSRSSSSSHSSGSGAGMLSIFLLLLLPVVGIMALVKNLPAATPTCAIENVAANGSFCPISTPAGEQHVRNNPKPYMIDYCAKPIAISDPKCVPYLPKKDA